MTVVRFEANKAWITIGAAATALATLLGGAVWATAYYTNQSNFNETVLEKLQELKESVDKISNDGVSESRVEQLLELLRARNPTLVVPDLPR